MKTSMPLLAGAPVENVSVVTVFALVQLRRVVVLDRAWLGERGVVPVVRRPSHERASAFFACK